MIDRSEEQSEFGPVRGLDLFGGVRGGTPVLSGVEASIGKNHQVRASGFPWNPPSAPVEVRGLYESCFGPGDEGRSRRQSVTIPDGVEFDHEVYIDANGALAQRRVHLVADRRAYVSQSVPQFGDNRIPVAPESKVHPRLGSLLHHADSNSRMLLDILVGFWASEEMPVLPPLVPGLPRDAEPNRSVMRERRETIADVTGRRFSALAECVEMIRALGGHVKAYYVVGNILAASVPEYLVEAVAKRPEVACICLAKEGSPPPGDGLGAKAATVADGRALVQSDLFWQFGIRAKGVSIAILDTGTMWWHALLGTPSPIAFKGDCVAGVSDCTQDPFAPSAFDPTDPCGHGTSTSAIIAANASMGDEYRGLTEAWIDSFKVYDKTKSGCELNAEAVVAAFDAAVERGDSIILAEMQAEPFEYSPMAKTPSPLQNAATEAFNSGSLVLAPTGNTKTVCDPAFAHKVLGVGAYDAKTLQTFFLQGCGPTNDGRVKPDFQCPTNTDTAQLPCDGCGEPDSCLWTTCNDGTDGYGGTSGAGPYAAGVAALLLDFYSYLGWATNPGLFCAALIAFGDRAFPEFDNEAGAGHLALGGLKCCHWYTGSRVVAAGGTVDIPFMTTEDGHGDRDARVALWWPEKSHPAKHNHIDLLLLDQFLSVRAESTSPTSVFQSCKVGGQLGNGVWTIRIVGAEMAATSSQTVYFFLYHKTWCADV